MDLINENWLQAQYSVLGAALIDPEAASRVISGTTVDDYTGKCLDVYEAIRKVYLSSVAVDPVTVNHELDSEYQDFLVSLMNVTPSAANVDHYINLCREQARTTHLRVLAQEMADATTAEQIRTLLDRMGSLLSDKPSGKIVSTQDALQDFQHRHSQPTNYLSWPLHELDTRLYAEPGDLIIVGGAPSTGKSAITIQCAWHWAKDHKVGFLAWRPLPESSLIGKSRRSQGSLWMPSKPMRSLPPTGTRSVRRQRISPIGIWTISPQPA